LQFNTTFPQTQEGEKLCVNLGPAGASYQGHL